MPVKYLFAGLLVGSALSAQAQYLSLEALIQLRGQDVEGVNAQLTAKGWRFSSADAQTRGGYSVAIWSYGQGAYSERARAFVRLHTAEGYFNKVSYQTGSKEHYTLLKSRLLANKMTKLSSTTEDGYITSTYAGANYYVIVSTSTDELTHMPVYNFTVGKKGGPVMPAPEAAEDESGSEETELAAEPTDLEMVSEEPVMTKAEYTYLVDKEDTDAPQQETVVLEDEVMRTCELYSRPWNTAAQRLTLEVGTPVKVIGKLLDEEHSYYFVYAQGQYGYVKYNSLLSNKDQL